MKKHTKKHSNIPSSIGHNNPPKEEAIPKSFFIYLASGFKVLGYLL